MLYNKLTHQIANIESAEKSIINRAIRSTKVCRENLHIFYKQLSNYQFANNQEEILFFKQVKPNFCSHQSYFQKILKIELARPIGDVLAVQHYLTRQLEHFQVFFDQNNFFFAYYRTGATVLDEKFFLRTKHEDSYLLFLNPNDDPTITTGVDLIFAEIKAIELIQKYILNELMNLNNHQAAQIPSEIPKADLTWTDAKTSLIELAYALHAAGSFNHGKADLKQIIEFLQSSLGVDLGNTSRTFQEILSRKTGYTNYIDHLKNKLLNRIDKLH